MDSKQTGENSLKTFLQTLHKVSILNNKKFDLILGAGDSGQVMIAITKIFYDYFHLPFPKNIVFPVYRYKKYSKRKLFDNSSIKDDYLKKEIPAEIDSILFVDDEIENGVAAKATLDLFLSLKRLSSYFVFTIIAEDGGVDVGKLQEENYSVVYYSPKKRIEELYNAISYIIPEKYVSLIKKSLAFENISCNNMQLLCILLNLPVKELENLKPKFNYRLQNIVKKSVPNLEELQLAYQEDLTKEIRDFLKVLD